MNENETVIAEGDWALVLCTRTNILIAYSSLVEVIFGLPHLPSYEVPDAFAVDIMSNTPTSDVAVKFAEYVLENVDSKFPPTL